MKVVYLKYGLTALMMAFAMTLCFSCSSDDEEEPSEKAVFGLKFEYDVQLTGRDFSESKTITNREYIGHFTQTHDVHVGDTLSLSVKPLSPIAQLKSVDAWDGFGMISFDKETNKVFIVKKEYDGKTILTVEITDKSGASAAGTFQLQVLENN